MKNESLHPIREFAIELGQRAGTLALEYQTRGLDAGQIRTKTHYADIVTEADVAVEALILAAIRDHFPDHAILAEESAGSGASGQTGCGSLIR